MKGVQSKQRSCREQNTKEKKQKLIELISSEKDKKQKQDTIIKKQSENKKEQLEMKNKTTKIKNKLVKDLQDKAMEVFQ